MINDPPIDELAEKIGSKYGLCVVCSKRARQIIESNAQNKGNIEYSDDNSFVVVKPLSEAADEIYQDKVKVAKY